MKQIYLSFILIVLSVQLTTMQAQDYQISFTGTGAATAVESIEVLNLTQGTSLSLSQGDILHLKDVVTSIYSTKVQEGELRAYPNPMTERCNVEFLAKTSGIYSIELYDLTGKKMLSNQYNLKQGGHVFSIQGLSSGIYNLSIKTDNYFYTTKLLSKNNASSSASITYAHNKPTSTVLKRGLAENYVQMQYAEGDRLLISATSGNYTTVKSLVPNANTTETFNFVECTDGSGNNYPVVQIGDQVWMKENLKTTKYVDGTVIPTISDENSSGTTDDEWAAILDYNTWETAACCYYNDDENSEYGVLYTYAAAMGAKEGVATVVTGEVQGACPTGWHVPTNADWTALKDHITSEGHSIENGDVLKTTEGWNSNGNGADSYGFSALPGGCRFKSSGSFFALGEEGYWWCSEEGSSSSLVDYYYLTYNIEYLYDSSNGKSSGYSIRCIRD